MSKKTVVGIYVSNRVKEIPAVQQVFTEFGCNIKTRLGLHEAGVEGCAPSGLILLEMIGKESRTEEMIRILEGLEGVCVQKMVFEC